MWDFVQKKDSMSVYKQQVNQNGPTHDDVRVQAPSSLPSLLVTGIIKGRCDDVMFGLLSTSTEALSINNKMACPNADSERSVPLYGPQVAGY